MDYTMTFDRLVKTEVFKERIEDVSGCLTSIFDGSEKSISLYTHRGFAFEPHDDHTRARHMKIYESDNIGELLLDVLNMERCQCEYCRGIVD
jgi:hypothetical protein